MKKLLFILLLFLFACSKEEPKLELFSAEAFAFQLDTTWELNSTARVKGFSNIETDSGYAGKVEYHVNFYTPGQDTIKNLDFGELNYSGVEEGTELVIDLQVELDETFVPGKYFIEYIAGDKYKLELDTLKISFELN